MRPGEGRVQPASEGRAVVSTSGTFALLRVTKQRQRLGGESAAEFPRQLTVVRNQVRWAPAQLASPHRPAGCPGNVASTSASASRDLNKKTSQISCGLHHVIICGQDVLLGCAAIQHCWRIHLTHHVRTRVEQTWPMARKAC